MELLQNDRIEHKQYVESMSSKRDWAGLVRYGIAHWYNPAFQRAFDVVHDKAMEDPCRWQALSQYLGSLAFDSTLPKMRPQNVNIDDWGISDRFTISCLFNYPVVCNCVSGEAYTEYHRHAIEAGIVAANECLRSARLFMFSDLEAYYSYLLGRGNEALGLLERASSFFRTSLDIYRRLADNRSDVYIEFVADTLNELAIVYDKINCEQIARDMYREAIAIYRSLNGHRGRDHRIDIAMALINAAIIQEVLDGPLEASHMLKDSLNILRDVQHDPSVVSDMYASALISYGRLQRQLGDHAGAITSLDTSLAVYEKLDQISPGSVQMQLARGYSTLGDIRVDQGALKQAELDYQKAALQLDDESFYIKWSRPEDAMTICKTLGAFYSDPRIAITPQFRLEAKKWYQRGVKCAEIARSKLFASRIRREALVERHHIYHALVLVCLQVFEDWNDEANLDEAIKVAEMCRSRDLLDLMVSACDISLNSRSDIVAQISSVRNELNRLIRLSTDDPAFFGDKSADKRVELEREIQEAESVLESLNAQIRSEHDSLFHHFQMDKAPILDLKQIQQKLLTDDRTVVLHFTLTQTIGFAFYITRSSVDVIKFPSVNTEIVRCWLDRWDSAYHETVRERRDLRGWGDKIANLLRPFEENILDPLFAKIGTDFDRLIVVPHQNLHRFPIHACRLQNQSYVGDVFEICYLPSLSVWRQMRGHTNMYVGTSVIVADPTEDSLMSEAEMSVFVNHFPRAEVISRKLKSTKGGLLKVASKSCVLHFAGHSRFEEENLYDSALRLTDGNDPQSFLSLRDIMSGLKLQKGSLVFLNGCESGMQHLSRVDDYLSLRFGFVYAGATYVVSTLWQVSDTLSTVLLVDQFYTNLQIGFTVAGSLKRAQQWVRNIPNGRFLAENVVESLMGRIEDRSVREMCEKQAEYLKRISGDKPPFESPVFWAPFFVTGGP